VDTLLPLFCLLLGVAAPLVIGGSLALRGWRQTAAPAAYRQVARAMDLEVDTRGASLAGYIPHDGRRLYVGAVMTGYGADRRQEHRGMVSLRHPLGLGLAVRSRTGRRWFRRTRGHEVSTDDIAFDKQFLVTADHDDSARAVLTADVRDAIRQLARRYEDVLLSDHHLRVRLGRPATSADKLHEIVSDLSQAADRVVAARARAPLPPRLAEVAPWMADLGAERELAFDEAWPRLSGNIGDHRVEIAVRREEEGHRAVISVWLPRPFDLGLRLDRQAVTDGLPYVGQDIVVGDAVFDAAFIIKGYAPQRVRALLGPDVRRVVLAMVDLGEVVVDDRLVWLGHVALDRATLRDGLDRALAAAARLDAADR
jgi:hypothetical protein